MSYFNVRAYGVLINNKNEVLLSDEYEYDMKFTKFPGGGVKMGEGIRDALIREYREECDLSIQIVGHIHTTDVLVKSMFNDSQVIAVYYLITASAEEIERLYVSTRAFDFEIPSEGAADHKVVLQSFRWVPVPELDSGHLTFEMDRSAWEVYLSRN